VGLSLAYRSPTECGVSECEREASIMRRPSPTSGCWPVEDKNICQNYDSYLGLP
jgi:hypothetical protein